MTTSISPETVRAWADIDLGAIVANARTIADTAGARLLPMLKADGYGLGAGRIAKVLERVSPWGYGVATIEEGKDVRAEGITRPIVVFTPFTPTTADQYLTHGLRPTIGDLEGLRAWLQKTDRPFHVEVDTGMARAGIRWEDGERLTALASELDAAPGWEGLFTHFHSADDNPDSVEEQWNRFKSVVNLLKRRPALVHVANSAAALRDRRYAADLVRPGIFLYGGEAGGRYPVVVVQLCARVVAVRRLQPGDTVSYGATWTAEAPTTVATVAAGYADGVPRSLSNRGRVEINGRIFPIVGRVTMDMLMVEVSDGQVKIGDVATIYGGRVSLDQQAAAAGTISYELLTSLGARVIRRYTD